MAPLIVLLATFAIGLAYLKLRGREAATDRAGRFALTVMFIFTGVSHFGMTEAMAAMLPPFVPQKNAVVWLTGLLEIAGAFGLLLPRWRRLAAYGLLAFLVAVFPANVYAAMNAVGAGGHTAGPAYLLFRAPLQLLFLGWTAWFGVRGATPIACSRARASGRPARAGLGGEAP